MLLRLRLLLRDSYSWEMILATQDPLLSLRLLRLLDSLQDLVLDSPQVVDTVRDSPQDLVLDSQVLLLVLVVVVYCLLMLNAADSQVLLVLVVAVYCLLMLNAAVLHPRFNYCILPLPPLSQRRLLPLLCHRRLLPPLSHRRLLPVISYRCAKWRS